MTINAEFIIKIKIPDLVVNSNVSAFELKQKLMDEGEKRIKYYASGNLIDPSNQLVQREVNYTIKED